MVPAAPINPATPIDCTTLVSSEAPVGLSAHGRVSGMRASLSTLLPAFCPGIKVLDCSGLGTSLVSLLGCPSTTQALTCTCTNIADLGPLAACTRLLTVDCSSTRVTDVGPLAGCPGLQTVNCRPTLVADLGTLAVCTLICDNTQIADLRPLMFCVGP